MTDRGVVEVWGRGLSKGGAELAETRAAELSTKTPSGWEMGVLPITLGKVVKLGDLQLSHEPPGHLFFAQF